MTIPPRDPYYRRYWTRYNRPYSGCGCLYTLLCSLVYWLMSLFVPAIVFW
jgi:hypothetical protein